MDQTDSTKFSSLTPAVQTAPTPQQIALEDLFKEATPLVTAFFDNQEKMQQRSLAFDEKVLVEETKRHRTVIWSSIASVLGVLLLAGVFIWRGHDETAMDLIQLIAAIVGVGLGGYGVGQGKHRERVKEE